MGQGLTERVKYEGNWGGVDRGSKVQREMTEGLMEGVKYEGKWRRGLIEGVKHEGKWQRG